MVAVEEQVRRRMKRREQRALMVDNRTTLLEQRAVLLWMARGRVALEDSLERVLETAPIPQIPMDTRVVVGEVRDSFRPTLLPA